VTPRETLYTQREAARTKKSQKSRRNVNEENVHQMELLKVPEIIVRGGDLVARGPSAREHQPAARTTAAPAHLDRTAGAPVAPGSSSACSRWIVWMLTTIPAQASRCMWIVRFARREQGWGRVRRRCKSRAAVEKGSRWGSREDRTRMANGKV